MRNRCLTALLGVATFASLARADKGERPLWVVLPPVVPTAGLKPLGYLVQTEATRALLEAGFAELHLKQVLRVAERQGVAYDALEDGKAAARVRRALGGDAVVYAQLDPSPTGYTLRLSTLRGERASKWQEVALPRAANAMVARAAEALAAQVAGAGRVKIAPLSRSPAAVEAYAACHATLIEQPMGIESPTLLGADALARALKACRAALREDDTFEAAYAALGLGLALAHEDKDAVQALLRVGSREHLPLYTLGRYWLGTRYQLAHVGETALRQAISRQPLFLLVRGYLVEHLAATGQLKEALAALADYEKLAPRNPFLRGRRSQLEARLGDTDKAIATARSALELDPGNSESLLELAGRYLDADKVDEAIQTLEPVAASDRRPDVRARLGWALFQHGNVARAEKMLEEVAVVTEREPQKWRTHARALTDLARMHLTLGDRDKADRAIVRVIAAGYTDLLLAQKDPKVQARAAQILKDAERWKKTASRDARGRELSPFRIGANGELDAGGREFPPPPPSFELLGL